MSYESISSSVRGAQRRDKPNEDSFIADDKREIYIVADGLGGHAGGSTASNLSVSLIHQELSEFNTLLKKNPDLKEDIPYMLEQILELSDEVISICGSARSVNKMSEAFFEEGRDLDTGIPGPFSLLSQYLHEMGTTIDACFIHDDVAYLGHVGNGRIYKMEGNRLRKLTTEHVDSPVPESTMSHDGWTLHERSMGLSNYLGRGGNTADILIEPLDPGEGILMMTDGYSHALSLSEMIHAFKDWSTAESRMRSLARMPNEIPKLYTAKMGVSLEDAHKKYDGMDNATFIAVRRVY